MVRNFFDYARERYQIKLRRDGGSGIPWTADPILQNWRFCNVFREDDKVTRWFKWNIRDRLHHQPSVVVATIIFRWFNRITTGKALAKNQLLTAWDSCTAKGALSGLSPLVTGAYMIKTPARMSKLDGLCWCIDLVWEKRYELAEVIGGVEKLQDAHKELMQFPYLGAFMAYEVVTDLRHTAILDHALDIYSWASAGPGAARGIGRVVMGEADYYNYANKLDQTCMLKGMRNLLGLSLESEYWPRAWPQWEMREVEHTLCEFDKYERTRLGEGSPKRRYVCT